jgi:[NiFe] hydrogenase diaphorase moiety large subunit
VETLVTAMMIMKHGPAKYVQLGTKDSRGSKVFSISGDTPIPGIFELELGMTVQQFVR